MDQAGQEENWRNLALQEVESIKPHFVRKHGWEISIENCPDQVLLYVTFHHQVHTDLKRTLRLAYCQGFPEIRPRETFVSPADHSLEGLEYWIDDGNKAFKPNHDPPVICLEGTWGFHSVLHKDRDPHRANINKLLLEIQACFNQTS